MSAVARPGLTPPCMLRQPGWPPGAALERFHGHATTTHGARGASADALPCRNLVRLSTAPEAGLGPPDSGYPSARSHWSGFRRVSGQAWFAGGNGGRRRRRMVRSRSMTLASCLRDPILLPPPAISSLLSTFGVTASSTLGSYGTRAAPEDTGPAWLTFLVHSASTQAGTSPGNGTRVQT